MANDMVTTETHCILACGNQAFVINLDRMQQDGVIEGISGISSVAIHKNTILIGTIDDISVHEMAPGYKLIKRFKFDMRESTTLTVAGDQVFIGGGMGPIHVFDLNSYALAGKLEGHSGKVCSILVEGPAVYSGGADSTMKMFDASRWALVNSVDCGRNVRCVKRWNDKIVSMVSPSVWIWE